MKPSLFLATAAFALASALLSAGQVQTASLTLAAVLRDEAALAGAHDVEVRAGIAFIAGKGFTRRNLPASGVFRYEPGRGGSLAVLDVKQPAAP
jgi:hypothetical protein